MGEGWAIRCKHMGGFLALDVQQFENETIGLAALGGYPVAWKVSLAREEDGTAEYIVRYGRAVEKKIQRKKLD